MLSLSCVLRLLVKADLCCLCAHLCVSVYMHTAQSTVFLDFSVDSIEHCYITFEKFGSLVVPRIPQLQKPLRDHSQLSYLYIVLAVLCFILTFTQPLYRNILFDSIACFPSIVPEIFWRE